MRGHDGGDDMTKTQDYVRSDGFYQMEGMTLNLYGALTYLIEDCGFTEEEACEYINLLPMERENVTHIALTEGRRIGMTETKGDL